MTQGPFKLCLSLGKVSLLLLYKETTGNCDFILSVLSPSIGRTDPACSQVEKDCWLARQI